MEIAVRKVDEDEAVRNLAKEEAAKDNLATVALMKEDLPAPNSRKRGKGRRNDW